MIQHEGRRVLRILHAEPDSRIREACAYDLARMGHCYEGVQSGELMLQEMTRASVPYDLLMVEIAMPSLDGIETVRLVREHERNGSLKNRPVLFFSDIQPVGDLARAMQELHPCFYQPKVIGGRDNLFPVLERVLAHKDITPYF